MLLFLFLLWWCCTVASAMGNCPQACICKWKGGKETAECIDRKLITIPENIDPGTQVLDMSDNNLQILPAEAFKRVDLLNLQKIYLRSCHLGQIDDAAFEGLTNLVELDLSHNLLTSVPTATLTALPSLRDFTLSGNAIQKIEREAFGPVPQLVKLDLSHCEIQMIASHAFIGLEMLHTLKLNGNRLTELRATTIQTLGKLRNIELHDNPWLCDCRLRATKIWLNEQNIPFPVAPICAAGPERVLERTFTELHADDFACKPDIRPVSRIVEATTGENASIECRSHAVPSAKISWYWNGKQLINNTLHNSYQRVHIYEDGVFDKKSKLILTNAQETDSSEFYCVAENAAGAAEANFTLHVSFRAAGMRPFGDKQLAGMGILVVIFIFCVLSFIAYLLVRMRSLPSSESKTPGQLEVITTVSPPVANGKVHTSTPPSLSPAEKPVQNPVQKPPRLTDLPYSTNNYEGGGGSVLPPSFGSPTSTGGNNPDLINDTRGGSGQNLNEVIAGTSTSSTCTTASTVQMANLLAEMNSGEYRTTGCDSLYPSGLWDTNLLLQRSSTSSQSGGGQYSEKLPIINTNLSLDDEAAVDDYLSRTFPRTNTSLHHSTSPHPPPSSSSSSGISSSNNNTNLSASYHHPHHAHHGIGYPMDYGLPMVPGAELMNNRTTTTMHGSSIPNIAATSTTNNNVNNNTTAPPMNAKTLRVWQKGGVPVLPPVTALKRALTNSRNSPDEGYQEGCGTDV